jgi:hypothetical protein
MDVLSGHAETRGAVVSKTDTAMANEVLCKFLCHNPTCLIMEQETLDIASVFWPEEEARPYPVILPTQRA